MRYLSAHCVVMRNKEGGNVSPLVQGLAHNFSGNGRYCFYMEQSWLCSLLCGLAQITNNLLSQDPHRMKLDSRGDGYFHMCISTELEGGGMARTLNIGPFSGLHIRGHSCLKTQTALSLSNTGPSIFMVPSRF